MIPLSQSNSQSGLDELVTEVGPRLGIIAVWTGMVNKRLKLNRSPSIKKCVGEKRRCFLSLFFLTGRPPCFSSALAFCSRHGHIADEPMCFVCQGVDRVRSYIPDAVWYNYETVSLVSFSLSLSLSLSFLLSSLLKETLPSFPVNLVSKWHIWWHAFWWIFHQAQADARKRLRHSSICLAIRSISGLLWFCCASRHGTRAKTES